MGALLHTKSTVATYPLIHLIYPTTTMFIKNTALLAFGASAVAASPLGKRQVSSAISAATSAAGSAVGSATSMAGPSSSSMMTGSEMMSSSMVTGSPAQSSAASTVTATGTDAMASSSIESAVSSVASSAATGTSSAAAPTMTSEANATSPEAFAFGCPDGYSLTYVIGLSSHPEVEITTAYDALMDWGVAIPPPIMPINSTGSGEGAMRSWSLMNLTVTETLNNQTMNETTGFLNQNWNLSMPLEVSPSLIISNATSDLTLYSNSTTNDTSVQFYVNFCVSDQQAGLALYSELATAYLTGLNSLFMNSTMSGNMTGEDGMMSSSMMSSSMMMPSSMMSSSETGVAASATSGASSVASAGISGASSAAGAAISAVTGVLPTRA